MPIEVKYGKFYMKDASGNLHQIVPESASPVPDYQGATASASGQSGMVPAAQSSQKDKFLKGDGTWASVNSNMRLEIGSRLISQTPSSSPYTAEDLGGIRNNEPYSDTFSAPIHALVDNANALGSGTSAAPAGEQLGSFQMDCSSMTLSDDSVVDLAIRIEPIHNDDFWITYTLQTTLSELLEAEEFGLAMVEDASNAGPQPSDNAGFVIMEALASTGREMHVTCTDNGDGTYTVTPFVVSYEKEYESTASLEIVHPDGTEASIDMTPLNETIGVFKGASEFEMGDSGLVPSARPVEKDNFLRGDGTWAEVVQPAIVTSSELSTGTETAVRTVSPKVIHDYVAGEVASGVAGMVNSAPEALDTLNELAAALGNDANFATTVSTSLGGKVDKTSADYVKSIDASGQTITYTKGDNTTQSVSVTVPAYQGANASANGLAGLVPSATSAEKDRFLKGDGSWAEVTAAKEVGYVSSEPTDQSVSSMDAQALVFYETENGTANSEQELNASITGTAAYASRLNHSLTIKINSGSTEGTNQYSFNGSSETALNLVSGSGAILSAEQGTVSVSVPAYQGATASANGVAGLVPPASSIQRNQYLRGDGTWGEVNVPSAYRGATAELEGTSGLVPAPAVVDRNKFLKGDGTWSELTLPAVYQGATPMESGIAGLVPSAAIADREKFLKGDGTWTAIQMPGVYVGANAYSSGTAGLVPSAESSEQDWFLCGNGAWTPLDLITNAEVDALFEE